MEILKQAISITSKYGISLHKFGPFLSYYDNKIGICLDIQEKKFGYLTRNYQFENINDFESFLKKYAYYKNVLKGNTNIIFDNYENVSPQIKYGFEEKKLIDKKNEEIEIFEIKKIGDSLYLYLEKLYDSRIEQLELRQKAYNKMNENLVNYKKNLYTFYNKTYEEEFKASDNFLNNYKLTIKSNLKQFNELNKLLKNSIDLDDTKQLAQKVIMLLKQFELDRDYYSSIYDYYLFKNKAYLLVQMSNHILKRIESKGTVTPQELKTELEDIKTKIVFSNSKDTFINDEFDKIENKYSGILSVEEYNFANYLYNMELKHLKFIEYVDKKDSNVFPELIDEYSKLKSLDKEYMLILFSPFGKIISQMYGDVSKNADNYILYEDFYNEILELLNNPENLIIKSKYFQLIDFNSFETFINSLLTISKYIEDINITINNRFNLWAYPTERLLINASNDILKSYEEIIDCLEINPGVNLLYSVKRINIINGRFVLENNNNIFIKKENNVFNTTNNVDCVKDYKFIKDIIKLDNKEYIIVKGIDNVINYRYCNYIVEVKDNE